MISGLEIDIIKGLKEVSGECGLAPENVFDIYNYEFLNYNPDCGNNRNSHKIVKIYHRVKDNLLEHKNKKNSRLVNQYEICFKLKELSTELGVELDKTYSAYNKILSTVKRACNDGTLVDSVKNHDIKMLFEDACYSLDLISKLRGNNHHGTDQGYDKSIVDAFTKSYISCMAYEATKIYLENDESTRKLNALANSKKAKEGYRPSP